MRLLVCLAVLVYSALGQKYTVQNTSVYYTELTFFRDVSPQECVDACASLVRFSTLLSSREREREGEK